MERSFISRYLPYFAVLLTLILPVGCARIEIPFQKTAAPIPTETALPIAETPDPAPTPSEDVGPIPYAAGSDVFLPYQTCFDLDLGKFVEGNQPPCDFSVQTLTNEEGRIYLQFSMIAEAGFAFQEPFSVPESRQSCTSCPDTNIILPEGPPTPEQCAAIQNYSTDQSVTNPIETYLCYRTGENRYGFFHLKDWDIDNGLTFNWQTFTIESDFIVQPAVPNDSAAFVADLTILDGSEFSPGESFTKSWRLRNNGNTTWTRDYSLVFITGNQMNGPSSIPLPIEVPPEESIDLYVDLTAPTQPGEYTSHWMLENASGEQFGIGFDGIQTFYVNIIVN